MKKNIIFTLFGIVGFMMTPVGANAARCSYATNSSASTSVADTYGPWMIDLRSECSDNKIFYCDKNTEGKVFYGSVEQKNSDAPFIVTPSGEKSLYRCNGKYWVPVKQDTRSCCNDCSPIRFNINTCNCSVYISDRYGWSLNKCGSENCGGLICTDASVSGTLDYLPWNSDYVTQHIRNNIVYYNDDCSLAGSYYECSRTKNYYKYIWAEIGNKGGNFPWVVIRGKARKLLFCDGTAWKELSQITDWKQMKCKKVLNHCGTFYTNDTVWSRNPCHGLDNNDGGNSECTGCCQDLPLHSDVSNAMDVLNNFASNASVNVWVNQDGKFNSARLATDIASGVVLGTVGGLVSNVIIKNNQIKDGMTGYYCTVGSDTVADYGDEFIIDFPE